MQKNFSFAIIQSENAMSVDNLSKANMLLVSNLRGKEDPHATQPHGSPEKGQGGRRSKLKELKSHSGRGSHQSLNQDLSHLPYKGPTTEEIAEA